MKITEELKSIKREFENSDRRKAMQEFMRKIYYEIAPAVAFGDRANVFKDEKAVAVFCEEKGIDMRAFRWLLGELSNEGLILPYPHEVSLSELGVGKLCIEK